MRAQVVILGDDGEVIERQTIRFPASPRHETGYKLPLVDESGDWLVKGWQFSFLVERRPGR